MIYGVVLINDVAHALSSQMAPQMYGVSSLQMYLPLSPPYTIDAFLGLSVVSTGTTEVHSPLGYLYSVSNIVITARYRAC